MKGFVSALLSSWLLGGHAQNIVPDCGRAFQPCCTGAESCVEGFSCIDRGAAGIICEPCGDPFSQPCPMAPYCSSSQLVPTASAMQHYVTYHEQQATNKILLGHPSRLCAQETGIRPCSVLLVAQNGNPAALN